MSNRELDLVEKVYALIDLIQSAQRNGARPFLPFHPHFHANPPCTRTIYGTFVKGRAVPARHGGTQCEYE